MGTTLRDVPFLRYHYTITRAICQTSKFYFFQKNFFRRLTSKSLKNPYIAIKKMGNNPHFSIFAYTDNLIKTRFYLAYSFRF